MKYGKQDPDRVFGTEPLSALKNGWAESQTGPAFVKRSGPGCFGVGLQDLTSLNGMGSGTKRDAFAGRENDFGRRSFGDGSGNAQVLSLPYDGGADRPAEARHGG